MTDQLKIGFILFAGVFLSAVPFLPANPTPQLMQIARKKANANDVTAPTLDSATIDGDQLVLNWSEPVTGTSTYLSQFNADMSTTGTDIAVSTHDSGNGTAQWTLTMASAAVTGETVDLDYDDTGSLVNDGSANPLASFSDAAVTNNTTSGPPATGLVAHYEADSGAYNDAGTTLATDGQTVQQWNDQSGNGNHLTQATEGSRPLFQTNELNSLPGIQFQGTDDFLVREPALVTSDPFTVVAVAKTDNAVSQGLSNEIWFNGDKDVTADLWSVRFAGATSSFQLLIADSSFDTPAGGSLSDGTFYIISAEVAASNDKELFVDGTSVATSTTERTPDNADRFALGMLRDSSPSDPLTGVICEVLVYSNVTQRGAAESYLSAKWGISIP